MKYSKHKIIFFLHWRSLTQEKNALNCDEKQSERKIIHVSRICTKFTILNNIKKEEEKVTLLMKGLLFPMFFAL